MNHKIQRLRRKAGLTQVQLAAKAGVSRSYIADMEAGHRRAPSVETLKRLAKALGATVAELIE